MLRRRACRKAAPQCRKSVLAVLGRDPYPTNDPITIPSVLFSSEEASTVLPKPGGSTPRSRRCRRSPHEPELFGEWATRSTRTAMQIHAVLCSCVFLGITGCGIVPKNPDFVAPKTPGEQASAFGYVPLDGLAIRERPDVFTCRRREGGLVRWK